MKKWKWREAREARWRRRGCQRAGRGGGSPPRQAQDRRRYGNHHQAPPSTASQGRHENQPSTSSSCSSSSSKSSAAAELPGFYFDPEKNRYFRLLPGHNNCNPLTTQQLQEKEREKLRTKMLEEDSNPRKKAPRAGLNTSVLLQKRSLGLLAERSYCRRIHEAKVSAMRRHKLEIHSAADNSTPNMDNFRLILGDSACERVFTVSDVSHGGCQYGIMKFGSNGRGSLSVQMCDNLYFTNRKVNSVCWASVNSPDSHVLLCLVGAADTPGCVTLLPTSLFSNLNPDEPGMLCSFKISSAWSCAWCLNPMFDKTFSTGLSRRVMLKEAETGRTQSFSVASDVLAQQFAVRVPVLFNGCRSGEIFSMDLRQRGGGGRRGHSWKASRFHQQSAITSLRLLQDHNYLLAADMCGQIKLWDVRATKPVQDYKGHHNEHAYLPIHVNEPEGLLLAVGQDCYTRIWSLRDGHLLRSIPSPEPASNQRIPSVLLSSGLGGRRGLPGLLMALAQNLYYFPYNTDEPQQPTASQQL